MGFRAVTVIGCALLCAFGVEAKKAPSLKWPVMYSNVAKVQELLDQGADANEKDAGVPMLIIAARTGNIDILKLLVARGAVVDATDLVGMTALCAVSMETKEPEEIIKANIAGNEKVLEAYRKRGNEAAAKEWLLPTDPAVYASVADRAKTLVALGANPNFVFALESTPFLEAVKTENIPLVKALLETGKADPELRFHQWVSKIVGMVSKVDVKDFAAADTGKYKEWDKLTTYDTPLLYAIEKGNLELVKTLVEGGANVNNGKKKESSSIDNRKVVYWVMGPMYIAMKKGNAEIIDYLKSKDAVYYKPDTVE